MINPVIIYSLEVDNSFSEYSASIGESDSIYNSEDEIPVVMREAVIKPEAIEKPSTK